MKKFLSLLIIYCIGISLFSGCVPSNKNTVLRFDIPTSVVNLDPQLSANVGEHTIIYNAFDSLMRFDEAGLVTPSAAKNYQLSSDSLTYTFTLREDLKWSDQSPVTSMDYAFGLSRLFSPATKSPFSSDFISIKNARLVLSGQTPVSDLGIYTPNSHTLVITLEQPNPNFLYLMAHTASMPCKEEFFTAQKGRYGTKIENTLFNGAFVPVKWTSTSLSLRPNTSFYKQISSTGVDIYSKRGDTTTLFLENKTDFCLLPYEDIQISNGYEYQQLYQNNWSILFNTTHVALNDPTTRHTLLSVLDRERIDAVISEPLLPSYGVIGPETLLLHENYRAQVGYPTANSPLSSPKETLYAKLSDQELTKLPKTTILASNVSPGPEIASYMQQQFANALSVYVNIELIDNEMLNKRLTASSFDIIIAPIPFSSESGCLSYLSPFGGYAKNYFGYDNADFNTLLTNAQSPDTALTNAQLYLQAEQTLLEDSVLMPLFVSPTRFVWQKNITGIIYSSATNQIDFTNGVKK